MAKIKTTIKKDSPAADIIKAAKAEKQAAKEAIESGNNKQQTVVEWLKKEISNEDYHTEGELGNSCIDVNTLLTLLEQIDQSNPMLKGSTALVYKDGTPMRKYNSPKLQAIEMENKQTAVEWLIEQIKKDSNIRLRGLDLDELEEQAKQMEKEQMHKVASFWRGKENEIEKPIFQQYYNETFKK